MQNDFSLYRPRQPSYFLDLFSGIGGFHLGAQWAGLHFDGYYYSEVDPYAIKVYAKRFPDAIGLGDITKIDGRSLPKGDWIIAGGFPCQDISVAGKGAGLAGSRSGLWYEYARIISELRPKYAIMENVGALTFRGLDAVLGSLAEIGYDAEWQDIRASDVGAPHRRERIWIVAYPELRRISERRRDDGTCGKNRLMAGILRNDASSLPKQTASMVEKVEYKNKGHVGWRTESDVLRVAHGVPSRVDRLKCLGNSIVPQIAQMIFQQQAFDEWRNNAE